MPCERCRHSSRECSYPVKDRPVTVSESYLRGLEREARRARRAGLSGDSDQSDGAPTPAGNAATGPASGSPGIVARPDAEEQQQTFGDCSAEVFVKTLKELPFVKEPELPVETIISGDGISTSRYTYSPLDFDFLRKSLHSHELPRWGVDLGADGCRLDHQNPKSHSSCRQNHTRHICYRSSKRVSVTITGTLVHRLARD